MDSTLATFIGDIITTLALLTSIGFSIWQGTIAKKQVMKSQHQVDAAYKQVDTATKQITEMEQGRMDTIRPVLIPNGDIPRVFIAISNGQPPLQFNMKIQEPNGFILPFSNIGTGAALNV